MIERLSNGKRCERMRREKMVAIIKEARIIILSLYIFINSKPANDALAERDATWNKKLNVQHSTLNAQLSTSALHPLYGDRH